MTVSDTKFALSWRTDAKTVASTQLGLAYGRKLGEKVDLGAQFNYNGIRIAGYGNDAAISFELGTILASF